MQTKCSFWGALNFSFKLYNNSQQRSFFATYKQKTGGGTHVVCYNSWGGAN